MLLRHTIHPSVLDGPDRIGSSAMVESDGTAMVELTLLGRIPRRGMGAVIPTASLAFWTVFSVLPDLLLIPTASQAFWTVFSVLPDLLLIPTASQAFWIHWIGPDRTCESHDKLMQLICSCLVGKSLHILYLLNFHDCVYDCIRIWAHL